MKTCPVHAIKTPLVKNPESLDQKNIVKIFPEINIYYAEKFEIQMNISHVKFTSATTKNPNSNRTNPN